MGHPYHHALSSVRKWGGTAEDYLDLHQWFDESKMLTADFRHRALRHHAEGIFMLERFFGATITISTGRVVPTRLIGEQHVIEDLGFIPSFADWVRCIHPEPWMGRAQPIHKIVDPFAAGPKIVLPVDHDVQDPVVAETATKDGETAMGTEDGLDENDDAEATSHVVAAE